VAADLADPGIPARGGAGRLSNVQQHSCRRDVAKGGEDMDTDMETDLRLWQPVDGDVVIHDEVADSPARSEHAEGETGAEQEPQWYPPPGEPCM
jgi:hypothetical protein